MLTKQQRTVMIFPAVSGTEPGMNAPFVQKRGDREDKKNVFVSIPDVVSVPAYRLRMGYE
jgi:hypothetical protein